MDNFKGSNLLVEYNDWFIKYELLIFEGTIESKVNNRKTGFQHVYCPNYLLGF